MLGLMKWQGFGRTLSWPNQGTTQTFAWRPWGKSQKTLRIAGVLAEIYTRHLCYINIDCNHYTNQLGIKCHVKLMLYLHIFVFQWIDFLPPGLVYKNMEIYSCLQVACMVYNNKSNNNNNNNNNKIASEYLVGKMLLMPVYQKLVY